MLLTVGTQHQVEVRATDIFAANEFGIAEDPRVFDYTHGLLLQILSLLAMVLSTISCALCFMRQKSSMIQQVS